MTKAFKIAPRPAMFRAPDANNSAINELLTMHTYARPAGSKAEAAFCARYLDGLPDARIDGAGNRIVTIGAAPRILWSSHTDTVHKAGGKARVEYGTGILSLAKGETASCLGADCSVGVWIMRQMIIRRIPGLYIFHAAEEIGGIGSQYIAEKTPELLAGIDHAIALDRRGTDSVITHQWGGACCSTEFAESLARFLGGNYKPDSGGTFTDTANFTHLIPECTNISVGYYGAHSNSETLDVSFAAHLLERLCVLDSSDLPVMRSVNESDYDSYAPWDNEPIMDIRGLTYDNPGIAADILEDCGVTVAEFMERIEQRKNQRGGGWR